MKRFLLCALCAAALCGTANLMHIDKAQFSPAKPERLALYQIQAE